MHSTVQSTVIALFRAQELATWHFGLLGREHDKIYNYSKTGDNSFTAYLSSKNNFASSGCTVYKKL